MALLTEGLGSMFGGANNIQPITGQGTTNNTGSTPQIGYQQNPNQYSGFSWSPLNLSSNTVPLDHLGSYFKELGYTGSLYDQNVLKGAGVNSEDIYENRTSQALQDWLKSNNYTLYGSQGNDTGKKTGTAYDAILDAQGNIVGNPVGRSFDDSTHWMDYAVPGILAAMFGGAAGIAAGGGGAAGGAGSDALLGGGDALAAGGGGADAGLVGFNPALDSQLANLGGTQATVAAGMPLDAASVWGAAGNGMTGATVAGGAPAAIDLGTLGGIMQTGGGAAGIAGALGGQGQSQPNNPSAATPDSPFTGPPNVASGDPASMPTNDLSSILKGLGGNLLNNLTSAQGLSGLFGMYNANQQNNAWKDRLAEIDRLYATDSPYAKQMAETLARKDSAAGRNSQYGPRAENLAAHLTEARARTIRDEMQIQDRMNDNYDSRIKDLTGIFGSNGTNSIFSGLSTGFQDLLKLLGED